MSFFNKIIDRAKHGNNKNEESSKQSPDNLTKQDSNRSFFGIHTPHSSTSSSSNSNSLGVDQHRQQQQQDQLPKVQEESSSSSNQYKNGYVTPRQSQDTHQNMDIDTPGNY
jgi:hypothetical protein